MRRSLKRHERTEYPSPHGWALGTPWYRLTVTLAARGDQTHLAWDQEFESPEVATKFRPLIATANKQNFERLQSLLASEEY
jgi:hypothetical protein